MEFSVRFVSEFDTRRIANINMIVDQPLSLAIPTNNLTQISFDKVSILEAGKRRLREYYK